MSINSTEIAQIETNSALEIFTTAYGLDPVLQKIRDEINVFVPDMSTAKGRKEIASMAHKISKSKTYLDSVGKKLVDDLKRKPKQIDIERSRIKGILVSWRDEVRKPLTLWEDAETARVSKHEEVIITIKNLPLLITSGTTADQIKELLVRLDTFSLDALEELQELGQAAYNQTKLNILEALEVEKEAEQLAKEAELLKEQEVAREKKEHIARIKEQAIINADLFAKKQIREAKEQEDFRVRKLENEKKQAELDKQQAEQDLINAEERRKKAVIKAAEDVKLAVEAGKKKADADNAAREQQRLDALEKDRLAQQEREADVEHQKKINNEVLHALVISGIAEDTAKQLICLIATNKIPHTLIMY